MFLIWRVELLSSIRAVRVKIKVSFAQNASSSGYRCVSRTATDPKTVMKAQMKLSARKIMHL